MEPIVIGAVIVAAIVFAIRGLAALQHMNEARVATKFHRKVLPNNIQHTKERIARQHSEAESRVRGHWQPKIDRSIRSRDRAVRRGKPNAYLKHQGRAESLEHGLIKELGLVRSLLLSKKVDPRTGQNKGGIRRG